MDGFFVFDTLDDALASGMSIDVCCLAHHKTIEEVYVWHNEIETTKA
jgi:hypothetical protein